jgi:ABC-type uncharacterized transport system auxiliary subunit
MKRACRLGAVLVAALLIAGCATAPAKRYYTLNYLPSPMQDRMRPTPYPFTVRVRDFTIEEAYARPQIVYRRSPFELEYYFYRVWAVKPTRMFTDLVQKHLLASELVTAVVRRYDEGNQPQYELSGMIEAIEEYDSEETWFAHLALHLSLTRVSDGRVLYSRRFDNRKRVFQNQPEFVIKEMSAIMEYVMNQVTHDLDGVFASELNLGSTQGQPASAAPARTDTTTDVPEQWK